MWTIYKKTKKEYKNLKKQEIHDYIYQNELDKVCFQHDMAYGDFQDLTRRTAFDKILRDKAFNIAKYPKYDGYRRGLIKRGLQWFINLFIKRFSVELLRLHGQRP